MKQVPKPHSESIRNLSAVFLLLMLPSLAFAQGGSPFDTGFSNLQTLFTGTVAKVASLIAIVIGGYSFAHGELVALQWGDIQFGSDEHDSNRFILVQRNYVHGNFTTPKSKKSRRVDLSAQVRRVLLDLREERLLNAFEAGKQSISEDFIFPSKAGTVLDPDNLVHYYFEPALLSAGLRKFRFHDLRHTFGSQLIQNGASLAYVRDQMGHSSIQVTADVYGHLVPGANVRFVDSLDAEAARPDATQAQPRTVVKRNNDQEGSETTEFKGDDGERGRNRTFNLLIKSSLAIRDARVTGVSSGTVTGPFKSRRLIAWATLRPTA